MSLPGSSSTCDYFGLLNDSDDEEISISTATDDIIVNTYQTSDVDYGPTREEISKNTEKRKRKTNSLFNRFTAECARKKIKSGENNSGNGCWTINVLDRKLQKPVNPVQSQLPKIREKTLNGHVGCVNKVQWSFTNLLLSASMDHSVKIWDLHHESPIAILAAHDEAVRCASWNVDGTRILSGGYDKYARITDINTGQQIVKYSHENLVSAAQWRPEQQNVLLTGSFGVLNSWDLRCEDKPLKTYSYNCGQVLDVVFLPGGAEFICSGDIVTQDSADRTIMAWDFDSTAVLSNQIYPERYTCPHLAVHPNGQYFVAQSNGDYIAQFSTGRPYKMDKRKRFEGHKVSGYSVGCAFSEDGRYLYSGSSDGNIFCYEFKNTRLRRRIPIVPREAILSVSCHPLLESVIAVSSWSGKIHILQ